LKCTSVSLSYLPKAAQWLVVGREAAAPHNSLKIRPRTCKLTKISQLHHAARIYLGYILFKYFPAPVTLSFLENHNQRRDWTTPMATVTPRSKRELKSDGDTQEQTGFRATGRDDEASRTDPTPETQSLYDDIRMIEDGLGVDMQDRLYQLQGGSVGDHAPYLQPPQRSQAPTSPQSPSYASATHPPTHKEPQIKNSKAMRYGPLDNLKRARAALMRKLGACAECKIRKVRVRPPYGLLLLKLSCFAN